MKIGIVGAGQVGATAAYSMMMRRVGSEIVLVDRNADLALAQARDILDATPFADPVRVRAGEFADLDGAHLVVLAAGNKPEAGGEPVGSAVAQRRDLRRDRSVSVGGDAGPDFSGGDQSS
jgi:malate/lactate dehydrogenase